MRAGTIPAYGKKGGKALHGGSTCTANSIGTPVWPLKGHCSSNTNMRHHDIKKHIFSQLTASPDVRQYWDTWSESDQGAL
jgi:hypothetical protein